MPTLQTYSPSSTSVSLFRAYMRTALGSLSRLQAVYKQADGETLVDVVTEEGQELAGLPASDCCLQVRRALPRPRRHGRNQDSVQGLYHSVFA